MLNSPDVASLTLARSPFRTLYYFGCSVASGTASAAHFVATHPVTIGLALPLLLFYGVSKGFGYAEETTAGMEVGVCCTRATAIVCNSVEAAESFHCLDSCMVPSFFKPLVQHNAEASMSHL
eukprot:GHRR01028876.1.p1 GENE.GHRR01028876.1~~GHRR01028876.1.p1  ORF type:complete len:122 (+),score=31.57 GHRR01028876.1:578-943(+)